METLIVVIALIVVLIIMGAVFMFIWADISAQRTPYRGPVGDAHIYAMDSVELKAYRRTLDEL